MTASGTASLAGKVAFITGAASGIGAASARRFAELGATVVATDIDDASGTRLAAELGEPHRYLHLDVTDYTEWEKVLNAVQADLRGVDILFLNAGVMLRDRGVANNDDPFEWMTKERSDRVVDVNLNGVVYGFLAAIPHLQARGGGVVLLFGQLPILGADPMYTMAKQALVGFTRAVGPSAARLGITVVGIQPSGVDTPMIPPNVREAGVPLNPPERVAEDLVTVMAHAESGDFWLISPAGVPDPPQRYEFPPLPDSVTRTVNRTNSMFTEAIGARSIEN
jgi:NAD(P)-dependent dehydrogenase (short-subunit alcohol dehydrogenase family)